MSGYLHLAVLSEAAVVDMAAGERAYIQDLVEAIDSPVIGISFHKSPNYSYSAPHIEWEVRRTWPSTATRRA